MRSAADTRRSRKNMSAMAIAARGEAQVARALVWCRSGGVWSAGRDTENPDGCEGGDQAGGRRGRGAAAAAGAELHRAACFGPVSRQRWREPKTQSAHSLRSERPGKEQRPLRDAALGCPQYPAPSQPASQPGCQASQPARLPSQPARLPGCQLTRSNLRPHTPPQTKSGLSVLDMHPAARLKPASVDANARSELNTLP